MELTQRAEARPPREVLKPVEEGLRFLKMAQADGNRPWTSLEEFLTLGGRAKIPEAELTHWSST